MKTYELLEQVKEYQQEMIDKVNESSDHPEMDPDCDFALGYIAGIEYVIKSIEERFIND